MEITFYRIAIVIIFCALLFILIRCLSIKSKPSQVDISSLESLKNHPLYSLEELKERFEKIKDMEGVRYFDGHAWKGDTGRTWVYSYLHSSVNIHLWIYDNPYNSKNNFEIHRENDHKKLESKIVKISDDIDIILWNSDIIRNEYKFYVYDVLYTNIRIGNFQITLSETFYQNKTKINGIPTTKSIEMICQLLME